jgi:hypothetical protein
MGAILLGSAGSVPENDESTNSIPLPDSTPTDPVVLTEGIGIGLPDHGTHMPAGGLTDQVLTKLSDDDYSMAWTDPSGGGNSLSIGTSDQIPHMNADDDDFDYTDNFRYHGSGYLDIVQPGAVTSYVRAQYNYHAIYVLGNLRTALTPSASDSVSAVAYQFDTSNNFVTAGAKLVSVQNYNVEKFSIDKDGNVDIEAGAEYRIDGTPLTGGSYTFENGLTESTGTVKLGGALTGSTNIDIEDNEFSIFFDDGGYSGKILIGDSTFTISTWDEELYAGNRFSIHMLGGITLIAHDGTNSIRLDITETSFEIADTVNSKGVVYGGDYSGAWTDHSLVTKKWVTDNFAAI